MIKILTIIVITTSLLLSQDSQYIDSLQKVINKSKEADKINHFYKLSNYLADYSPKESIEQAKIGISLAEKSNDSKLGDFYLLMEYNYSNLTKYDSAYLFSLKAQEFFKDQKDTSGMIKAYNVLGIYHMNLNRLDSALKYFEQVKTLSMKTNDTIKLALAYTNMGIIDMNRTDYTKALEKFLLALNIYEKSQNTNNLLNIYVNLGSLLYTTNNYEKAIDYYFKCINLADEANDKTSLWFAYFNLGFVYDEKNDHQKALEYADKALEISEITNNDLNLAYSILSKIQFLIGAKEYRNIDNLFSEVENLWSQLNSPELESYYYDLKCDYAVAKNDYPLAMQYHEKMIKLMENQLYTPENKIYHSIRLGKIQSKLGQSIEGINEIKKAIKTADKNNMLKLKIDGYKNLYEIYEEQGKYQEAFLNLKLHKEFTDSFNVQQSKSRIEELEIIHNIQQKRQETDLLKKENIIQESKLRMQRFIIFISLFALIVAIGTVVIVVKAITNKKRLNRELQRQFLIIESQKTELEKNIASKDKLYSIIGHDLFNAHSNIASFINILRRTVNHLDAKFIEKLTTELELINQNSLNLLNTLVEWGNIQTKKKTYSPSSFNLKAMVHSNLVLFKKNIEEKALQINNLIDNNTEVYADKEILGTVLRNIISNSIKFNNYGGTIEIKNSKSDDKIKIDISDNGIGINEHHLDQLFKLEETIRTKGTSGEKGHGLGLLICKEMMDLHRSAISIESKTNEGTTVTLTIPDERPV
ncbi:MAG: tetratricopeptide repeat protein [Candidatus Marinimicrobia bacterium]|nr:tetratricopeptide repeat protein [Candidatus Neomarinimicrobiota bacterium]